MPRIHSDHAPILLRLQKQIPNLRKFHVENWWFNNAGFKETCEHSWAQSAGLQWKEKFKALRNDVKEWAQKQPTPQKRLCDLQRQIHTHQSLNPSHRDPQLEERLLSEYERAEEDLAQYWRQRARIQWQCEGDKNTNFFHMVATQRRRANKIMHIVNEEGRVTANEKEIQQVFVRYFKRLYCPDIQNRTEDPTNFFSSFQSKPYPKIPTQVHHTLTAPPTRDELRNALFAMGPDKAPGPDGITARFLQVHWHVLQHDLTQAMAQVFTTGLPPVDWLASHIVLIPKTEEPKESKDFRPITIGNIVYRLLMKVIATRLQPHMAKIISANQTAFLKGRHIADNTILVREIIHSFNSGHYMDESFLLKADIGKAFDTLQWRFMEGAMQAVQLPSHAND